MLDNATHQRKPAADFFYQFQHESGDYVYKETISTNPLVDRYEHQGRSMYALMMLTEEGKTATYALQVGKTGVSTVHTPQAGKESMAVQALATPAGVLQLTVTETPIFVVLAPTTKAGHR